MHARRPWQLAEVSLEDLRKSPPDIAVLPFGATEPHGRHLPYATDVYETDAIADRCCQLAHEQGVRVVALPTIPFGVQTSQQTYPLAINLYPSTLQRILSDMAEVLDNSGIRKAVILNGHGGNDFYTWLKESYGKHQVFLMQVHWFQVAAEVAEQLFVAGGDHANDMETSLMLHLHSHLVEMAAAGAQPTAVPRLTGMQEGWARAPRPWERYTEDSGAGDPRAATAEKGQQYFAAVCDKVAQLLVEFSQAEIDETFPFQ